MRNLLSAAGVVVIIGSAAPAFADPGTAGGDVAFLASLQGAGLTFASNDQAIAAGHAVCGLIDNGSSGLQVVRQAKADNPGLSMDDAAQFTALAASSYCPQQLTK